MDLLNKHYSALKLGNEDGLKYYMRVHGPSLRYFAFGLVKDKRLAEELVSDSFVKLWQGRSKIRSESSIKAFLFISIKHACLDQVNLLSHRAIHHDNELEFLENPSEDILTKMIQTELIRMIAVQVEKLPKLQSKVFKMTYFEQMDTEEISTQLGKSPSSIYFARSKALAALKRAFGIKHYANYKEG